jgi:predicted transcriptional regulator
VSAFASMDRGRPGAGRRRERSDLYATILEVVKRYEGDGRITRISYGAGMPVDRLRSSVERLVSLGLVQTTPRDGFVTYGITARGQEFLDTYWKMRGFIEMLEAGAPSPRPR